MISDVSSETSQTLASLSELFGAHKAEWLGPRLFELFSAPNYFSQMITPRPCILVGGRGTGKTTVLRGLSYQGQFQLENQRPENVSSWPYYGFYSRVDTNRVSAFKGPELDDTQWMRRFGHYTNLLMCIQVFRFLSWFQETAKVSTELSANDLASVASAFTLSAPRSNDHLLRLLVQSLTEFEAHINNVADSESPSLSLQGAPIANLLEAIKRNSVFADKLFFFLIDEYENLEDYQQRMMNTLIKHSGELYSFKVCVRELGWRVHNTLAENEYLVSPADYLRIDITDVMQGAQFEEFSHRVCQDRLAALVEGSNKSVADIRDLLPTLSEESEAALLGIEDHNRAVARELLKLAPVQVVSRLKPMEIYLLEFWRKGHNQTLREVFEDYQRNTALWRNRLDNYGHALLFTLRRHRRGIQKYYAGWDTFIRLSGGNIRFLLQLVESSLTRHLRAGQRLDKPLSPVMQTVAAQATGRASLTELEGISVQGGQMAKLLLGLGRIFGVMASSAEGHAPEVNQFRVIGTPESPAMERDVNTLLQASVMHLAVKRYSGSKLTATSDTHDWDYMLHPIYIPFFNFSYRRKRKMHLTSAQVLALVSSPAGAIREVLATTKRSPDEPLPEQLRLLGPYYADSN